jgi:hypothetical protein
MANYHNEVSVVSRGDNKSAAGKLGYHRGEKIRDNFLGKTYNYTCRRDVLHKEIILPKNAPREYSNPQIFINAVDKAEKRKDSQTLRAIIASLPNELSIEENIKLARKYVIENFVSAGMCASLAIHEGKNRNPAKNNPHMHILLTLRPINGSVGFSAKKNRDWNSRANVARWRESLAALINEAYVRIGIKARVSHESYIKQGKKMEAKKYLSRFDYEREKRGIRTIRGDINRAIRARNTERIHKARIRQQQLQFQRHLGYKNEHSR